MIKNGLAWSLLDEAFAVRGYRRGRPLVEVLEGDT
jgi:hypothetical protein